ncbi:uncharacterized protein LOC113522949 [Galleria mellonella]|uniref:Uncharacterized protein LOC113522949 n=1 Tax=Galleria mellonella TaxID=7137 RepID=A0A6J1X961_GALME|nr:uncharacterized protein LOC113522949 [Galleria mellonella]
MARAARIALDLALASSKALRPTLGHAWQYAKTEVAPPMTLGFFHGPRGKAMENSVSKFADEFIAGIESKINEMDAEKLRNVKEKNFAVKAVQETAKTAAKAKEDDRKREEEQKKKQAEKAAQEKAKKEKKLEPKAEKQSATIKEVEKKSEKKSNNKS